MNRVSIAILTGGESNRFGSNKLLFEFNGRNIVQWVYEKVKDFSDDVFLQGNPLNGFIPHREDLVHRKGALGGIYSALMNSRYGKTIVLAGDLPKIDPRIIVTILKEVDYDVVVPEWRCGFREPLCALYSKSLLPHIVEMLENNDLRISHLLEKASKVRKLDIDALIERGKLDRECFRNMNTKEDIDPDLFQFCHLLFHCSKS